MISDLELFEKLKFFDWLLKESRHLYCNKDTSIHKTYGRGRILMILKLENDLSTRELANRAGIRISSLNEILAKMVESGLVERLPLKEDKRVKVNHLTREGEKLLSELQDFPVFDCLTEEEKSAFIKTLDKLSLRLEENILERETGELVERLKLRREALERYLISVIDFD